MERRTPEPLILIAQDLAGTKWQWPSITVGRLRIRDDIDLRSSVSVSVSLAGVNRVGPVKKERASYWFDRRHIEQFDVRVQSVRTIEGEALTLLRIIDPRMIEIYGWSHVWRNVVDPPAPPGRYTMDDAGRIAEMKNRGFTEAREQLPELRRYFFDRVAEPFVPFHSLWPARPTFRPDENRSNVYKLYRATRCGPDTTIDPREQLAFYDAGLGSRPPGGALFVTRAYRWLHNVASQATGLGITTNIIDC
jgi:hypothetical protein